MEEDNERTEDARPILHCMAYSWKIPEATEEQRSALTGIRVDHIEWDGMWIDLNDIDPNLLPDEE